MTADVVLRGPVAPGDADSARTKVEHVADYAKKPVLAARVVLTVAADPAVERASRVEASLDVDGTQVRAHAVASDMPGAIDLLEGKLRENLLRLQDRERTRHRWAATDGEAPGWRHGDLPTRRGDSFPRPSAEREVVRRKTFALSPMTPDEAVFEMGILGHDFYLFTDVGTGRDAVVYRDGQERFAFRGQEVTGSDSEETVEMVGSAPMLSDSEAIARLDLSGEPFVFYLDPETRRGKVLYLRYDGHYGLITAAE